MNAVVDNDVLLKGACYGLLPTLIGTVTNNDPVGILGASRFVVPTYIKRNQLRGDPALAESHFESFLATSEVLEPSSGEQLIAASFEAAAQQLALNLDVGESQLVAILISRHLSWLLTGDKRAIVSIEKLVDVDARLEEVAGKIKCLERLVADALGKGDDAQIGQAICGEPSVDKTLSICFGCHSSNADAATALEGLDSYIRHLRKSAPRVLAT